MNAQLYVETETHLRAADLRIPFTSKDFVAVEIKTPRDLQDRSMPLRGDHAREIIQSAFKSADINDSGQLKKSTPGILALGAFNLTEKEQDILIVEGANFFLTKDIHKYGHIMGIIVLNFAGVRLPAKADTNQTMPRSYVWQPFIMNRYAKNTMYDNFLPNIFSATPNSGILLSRSI